MGVTSLWSVINTAREETSVDELKGLTLAIDLSQWLVECDAGSINCVEEKVPKVHVRNVFFRTIHLLKSGVRPIFILDGKVTELKSEEISRRLNIAPRRNISERRRLQNSYAECCRLFEVLGLPYFKSPGEAEALCAYLDKEGAVDGCITNDGDALLFGSNIVYTGFSMSSKTVSRYTATNIKKCLNIERNGLIALATLTGCDFNNSGAFGVGISRALDFLRHCYTYNEKNPIDVLRQWLCLENTIDTLPLCQDSKMAKLADKIRQSLILEDFNKVVYEFLNAINNSTGSTYLSEIWSLKESGSLWSCPKVKELEAVLADLFNWHNPYICKIIQPLLTRYRLTEGRYCSVDDLDKVLLAKRVIRRKTFQFSPCFEVEWTWMAEGVVRKQDFVTLEPVNLFKNSYGEMVTEFEAEEQRDKVEKQKRSKKLPKSSDAEGTMKGMQRIDKFFHRKKLVNFQESVVDDLAEMLQQVSIDKDSKEKQDDPKNPFGLSESWKPQPLPKTAAEYFGSLFLISKQENDDDFQ